MDFKKKYPNYPSIAEEQGCEANFYRTTDINDQWIDVNADELRNLGELIRGVYKI